MDQIVYRPVTESDTDQIIQLINEVFSPQEHFLMNRDRNWWEWKYNSCFGDAIKVVAEYRTEIVGVRLLWPWELVSGGRVLKAFHPVDTVVKAEFRGKGIFSSITKMGLDMARSSQACLIYNFPNQNSLNGYLKLGWKHISTLPWYLKILRPTYFYHRKFNHSHAQSVPADLPEDCRFTAEDLKKLQIAPDDSALIRTRKSHEYYIWRFIKHPVFRYGILSLELNDQGIHCIYFTSRFQSHLELFIVDVIGDPRLLPGLIRNLSSLLRRLKVSVVFCMDNNGLFSSTNMLRFGYLRMRNKNFVCLPLDPDLENMALDINNWRITGAMHDTL